MKRRLCWLILFTLVGASWVSAAPGMAQDGGETSLLPANLSPINIDNIDQLELLATLGRGTPIDAQWSPDGNWLAVLTSTAVWLYSENDLVSPPRPIANTHGTINCFTFHPDSNQIATGHPDGSIVLWDIETNTERGVFSGNQIEMNQIVFSPDGNRLASANDIENPFDTQQAIILWDTQIHQPIMMLENEGNYDPGGIAFSPDGSLLYANFYGYSDGWSGSYIRLYNGRTGVLLEPLDSNDDRSWGALFSIELSPDGTRLAGEGPSGPMSWITRLSELPEGWLAKFGRLNALEFSADSQVLFAIQRNEGDSKLPHRVIGIDFATREIRFDAIYDSVLRLISVQPTGRYLTVIGENGSLYHLDFNTDASLAPVEHFNGSVDSLAFADDNRIVVRETYSCCRWYQQGRTTSIGVWNLEFGEHVVISLETNIASWDLTQDGLNLIFGNTEGKISIWDFAAGEMKAQWQATEGKVETLSISRDGSEIVTSSGQQLRRWRRAPDGTFALIETQVNDRISILALRHSPDGEEVAIGGYSGFLIWRGEYLGPVGYDFSRDVFVSHTENQSLSVHQEIFGVYEGNFYALEFASDSAYLVAAGQMPTNGWSFATEVYLVEIANSSVAKMGGHTEPIWGVDINPDDSIIASASADGTVRLWSLEQRELLRILLMDGGANDVEFSADGRLLAVAGADGTVRLWGVPEN